MYCSPTVNVNPQLPPVGGVVMYIRSCTTPFHTALTSNPTVVRSSGVYGVTFGSKECRTETTCPSKTASNFPNSSEGEPGTAHLHACTPPAFHRKHNAPSTRARLAARTDSGVRRSPRRCFNTVSLISLPSLPALHEIVPIYASAVRTSIRYAARLVEVSADHRPIRFQIDPQTLCPRRHRIRDGPTSLGLIHPG